MRHESEPRPIEPEIGPISPNGHRPLRESMYRKLYMSFLFGTVSVLSIALGLYEAFYGSAGLAFLSFGTGLCMAIVAQKSFQRRN